MKKIIYIRLPRCGSTSVVSICTKNADKIKWFGGRHFGWASFKGAYTSKPVNYSIVECVKHHIGEKEYEDAYSFSLVRNPYARAVSSWRHRTWQKNSRITNFSDFCKALRDGHFQSSNAEWHATPLYPHLFDKSGQQLVDYICRLETIQEDIRGAD